MNARMKNSSEEVSDLIAYCLFDAFSLLLVDEKYKMLETKINLGQMLNVPLSTLFGKST